VKNTTHSADVEEICYVLERAMRKYFPCSTENADTFADQLTLFPRYRPQPRVFETRRGLSFVTRVL
jgi:hypothetical protein